MSAQSAFAFQPKTAADEVYVPPLDVMRAYARGDITREQAGLHLYYSCALDDCPQCAARNEACYEFEEGFDE
jgi:hypothetical protein